MLDLEAIQGWLEARLPGEVSADYVSLREHTGRGFEALGRVIVDNLPVDTAVRKIMSAIQDAEASHEKGARPFKIQIRIFRAKEEEASRCFSDAAHQEEPPPINAQSELVLVVRELRQLATESTSTIARLGRDSLQLAINQTDRVTHLTQENADLKAALFLAENKPADNLLETMLPTILTAVSAKLSSGALDVQRTGSDS
jgi:PHD/YefM family antitoxin component YafN of YafNO toxin-antitoxin module